MGNFGKWVSLIHELAQRIGAEVGIDNAGNGLGVDQIDRREVLVITNVHTLTNSAAHTVQTDSELVIELLANGTHATI